MRYMQSKSLRWVMAAVCVGGISGPPSLARGQGPVAGPTAVVITDVSLVDDGTLTVQVVDPAGNPVGGRVVRVLSQGAEVASATTDASGTFQVAGLRDGLHEVEACSNRTCFRLWQPGVAPPHAEPVARVVCEDQGEVYQPMRQVSRPQRGPLQRAFANYPIATTALIGAGLGAAIAIPIAVSQKPASP